MSDELFKLHARRRQLLTWKRLNSPDWDEAEYDDIRKRIDDLQREDPELERQWWADLLDRLL